MSKKSSFKNEKKSENSQDQKIFYQPSSNIYINDRNDVNEVKKFSFAVCREYLSGAWKKIDYEDLIVNRIS